MSESTRSPNRRLPEFTERNLINTKKSCPTIENLCRCDNAGPTADNTNTLLQSSNILRCPKPMQKKTARQRRRSTKKQNSSLRKRNLVSVRRATVPITPQMIRVALKELQTRRVHVSSALIASHLCRRYPIENNPDALKEELDEKLQCAVSVGLIVKCGNDKYCIPTLREQASSNKTAVTAFWNTYYRNGASSTLEEQFTLGLPRIKRHKMRTSVAPKPSNDYRTNNNDLDEADD